MLKACLLATAAVTTTVFAQSTVDPSSTSPSASASPSSSAKPKIVEISVGAELHKFVPDEVVANPGDTIRFSFYPTGHRVARAEFKNPCIPYEMTGALKKGFYSGVFNPNVITTPAPFYDVLVNDTEPIFFYCGAPGSCKEYSMVGVVNPTKEKTLAIQKEYASNSTIQLLPGEPWPSEVASQPNVPISTSPSGSGSGSESPTSGSSGLGAGAIAGIAIGAAAVILLGAALIYLCGRRGGFERAYRKTHGAPGIIPGGGMVENKYNDPKSPGATTMASSYDPYRSSTQPSSHLGYAGTPPPPHSPGMAGYAAHPAGQSPHGYYPPPMSDAGTYAPHQAPYHTGSQHSPSPLASPQFHQTSFQTHTPPPAELSAAVEYPTTNSPPPQYPQQPERRDSFTTGSENQYRSGKPTN
ncbi:hypothetical protein QBC39DRAFT_355448 [Podospora conica]|nr:hypothetical protein QBC39DRAFT_355448 [Schizothecium conicum]